MLKNEPIWDSKKISLHPALDFVENKAYLTLFLPYHQPIKSNSAKAVIGSKEVEGCWLLTSDKETILLSPERTVYNNFKIQSFPGRMENRWSSRSIENFVKNQSDNVSLHNAFSNIKIELLKYIDFTDEKYASMIAVWIIGTYFFPMFNAYPYIFLNAIKQCGKTKLCTLLSCLAFNGRLTVGASKATIYRSIDANRCTLIEDEAEKIGCFDDPERRSFYLSGYKKGAKVPRCKEGKGKNFEVIDYEIYSPKFIANIAGIENVLSERGIRVPLKRSNNKEIKNREIYISDIIWQELRNKLYLCLFKYFKEIKVLYGQVDSCDMFATYDIEKSNVKDCDIRGSPKAVSDVSNVSFVSTVEGRDFELWKPLLCIAKIIGQDVVNELLELSQISVNQKRIENSVESTDCMLAETLLEMIVEDDFYPVEEIKNKLVERFDYDEKHRWLNNTWLGKALRRLDVVTEDKRDGNKRYVRLVPEQIKDLAQRLQLDTFDTEIVLTNGIKVRELIEEIYCDCANCDTKRSSKFFGKDSKGKTLNYCDQCVEKLKKKTKVAEFI